MSAVHGNVAGLAPAELKELERLYRRRIRPEDLVSPEAARSMAEISLALGRQIGLMIDRGGRVTHVIVGDASGIFLPDLKEHPLGKRFLRGIRFIHTHLKGEKIDRDDLTDLSLLRLDLVAAISVDQKKPLGRVEIAILLPSSGEGEAHEFFSYQDLHQVFLNVVENISAREKEMEQRAARGRKLDIGQERAILVSVSTGPRWRQEESMEELAELARSSDLAVLDQMLQRPSRIDPTHLLGSGKLKELILKAMQLGATLIVFDQDLTPAQSNRIAEATELKVIDRSQLILDIFARRAHSREGKVQVELAQLQYRLPRLTGRGTAMSRLMGGIGGRGPGEMKLEVDRRRVRDRISLLEKQLESLSKARRQRKARRAATGIPIVSIVGYTNAGKSTLLNALTRSATYVEEKMFATLDTASRRLRFPKERDVIVTDTVGFIRDLPKDLFHAFRATLEEMEDADLLLHLVDASHPGADQRIESVRAILESIDLKEKPEILVLNKIDRIEPEAAENLAARLGAIPVSAIRPESFPPLLCEIESRIWPEREGNVFEYPKTGEG